MSWLVVARKEYMEHVRNYWILTASAIFLALMLVASGMASVVVTLGADVSLSSIEDTIGTMRFVAGVILPILALMLGYATIAGERESGSLALVVAQPLTRMQVLAGKYVGLWGVVATALVAGVGLGGLIVVGSTRDGLLGLQVLGVFLLETTAWGAAWLSVTMLVSAFFMRRSTAAAGAMLARYLFAILWVPLTVLVVALVAPPGAVGRGEAPAWLILLEVLNPNSAYAGLVSRTIGGWPGVVGAVVQAALPRGATGFTYGVALLAWIALPLAGAYALFRRRDV